MRSLKRPRAISRHHRILKTCWAYPTDLPLHFCLTARQNREQSICPSHPWHQRPSHREGRPFSFPRIPRDRDLASLGPEPITGPGSGFMIGRLSRTEDLGHDDDDFSSFSTRRQRRQNLQVPGASQGVCNAFPSPLHQATSSNLVGFVASEWPISICTRRREVCIIITKWRCGFTPC